MRRGSELMGIIIGRKAEQKTLLNVMQSKNAEFVVVYGRRRIGKTYLIAQFFLKQNCLFFRATGIQNGKLKDQLKEFSKGIGHTFYKDASIAQPDSWMQAFEELTKAIENIDSTKKIIIFLDELPWMATRRSGILEALGYYWNQYWSNNERIKLIVCGSSASWIIKNIIYNKGGLHNRATNEILLKAFSLLECREFLQYQGIKFNDYQVLQLYAVMGGVPHYLKHVVRGQSAAENINNLCFRENGLLFSEFNKLFKSLFKNAKVYIELIKIIASTRQGLARTDIEKKSKLTTKGGTLTERLNDLELAGFIKSFLPFKSKEQGIFYRVFDEYVYFYLKWIEPEKQVLLGFDSSSEYFSEKMSTPEYFSWMGYTFESICYKHISQIRSALGISSGTRVGTWRYIPKRGSKEQGAQIDLLFERKDGAISICEIKCTEKSYVIDKAYYNFLLNKINIYKFATKTTKQIFVAFISAAGLKKNTYAEQIVDGVVTLADLFK